MSQTWKERPEERLSHKDKERETDRKSEAYGEGVRVKVREKSTVAQGQLEREQKTEQTRKKDEHSDENRDGDSIRWKKESVVYFYVKKDKEKDGEDDNECMSSEGESSGVQFRSLLSHKRKFFLQRGVIKMQT